MKYRSILVFTAFSVCVLSAVVVNVVYGIDIVYTHLFYIPIILTGVWYPRYAICGAAVLGMTHIACDYATTGAFTIGSLLRAVMFMIVAYVTSYLALKQDRILNSLHQSKAALKQSHDELEQRVVRRTDELIRVNEELQKDITGRKKADAMMREQLHFLQQLLDAIPVPIFYKDRQGVYRGFRNVYRHDEGAGCRQDCL